MVTDAAFVLFSALALWSGWRVFRTDSMVRASFLLLLSFVAVAFLMLLLSAPYIGTATIFMMAVEMMVMALFMVMFMMNPAGLNPMQMVHQHALSIAAGVFAFLGIAAAVLLSELPVDPLPPGKPVVHDLGSELLGGSMMIFETAGVTLLATMVAVVVLSARSGRFGHSDQGSVPPGLEPGGPPAGRQPEESGGGHHGHDGQGGQGHGGNGHSGHGGHDQGRHDHGGDAHGGHGGGSHGGHG